MKKEKMKRNCLMSRQKIQESEEKNISFKKFVDWKKKEKCVERNIFFRREMKETSRQKIQREFLHFISSKKFKQYCFKRKRKFSQKNKRENTFSP